MGIHTLWGQKQFGDVYENQSWSENPENVFLYELEPFMNYKWKSKSDWQIKKMEISFLFERNQALDSSEAFDRWSFLTQTEFKLGYPSLELEYGYSSREGLGRIKDPLSDLDILEQIHTNALGANLKCPLPRDVSIALGAKLRFREANVLNEVYTRHSASVRLAWSPKFGKSL